MREALGRIAAEVAECAAGPAWALPDDDLLAAVLQVHGVEQQLAAVRLGLIREIDGRDLAVRRGLRAPPAGCGSSCTSRSRWRGGG